MADPKTKQVKKFKTGICLLVIIFYALVPLFRGEWKASLLMMGNMWLAIKIGHQVDIIMLFFWAFFMNKLIIGYYKSIGWKEVIEKEQSLDVNRYEYKRS